MAAGARTGEATPKMDPTFAGSTGENDKMKSPVVKRSIVIAGHKTSVSLEDAFWKGLKDIAGGRDMTLSDLVSTIDSDRRHGNLSSAIRLFVLDFYRSQVVGVAAEAEKDTQREQPISIGAVQPTLR
jgi:predicted DNA-binding ribbon-helix-helix protein